MLLVDTYNVLQTQGVLPPHLAGPDVQDLADLIQASRYAARQVRLVCDGLPPPQVRLNQAPFHPADVGAPRLAARRDRQGSTTKVLYAGPGREADDLIEELIGADSAPRRLLIVSSDRRVRAMARRRRAESLTSEAFLAHLTHDHARNPAPSRRPRFAQELPLGKGDLALWMAEFGVDDADFPDLRPSIAQARPSHTHATSLPVPDSRDSDRREPRANSKAASAAGREKPAKSDRPAPAPKAEPSSPFPLLPPPSPPSDPILRELLQEWAGRISLDDLDMRRWLAPPYTPDPTRPRGGRP